MYYCIFIIVEGVRADFLGVLDTVAFLSVFDGLVFIVLSILSILPHFIIIANHLHNYRPIMTPSDVGRAFCMHKKSRQRSCPSWVAHSLYRHFIWKFITNRRKKKRSFIKDRIGQPFFNLIRKRELCFASLIKDLNFTFTWRAKFRLSSPHNAHSILFIFQQNKSPRVAKRGHTWSYDFTYISISSPVLKRIK